VTGPDPAVTARHDQAAAADQHAREIIGSAAAAAGGIRHSGPPGPVERVIIRRLLDLGTAKQITVCQHLAEAGPQPEFWQAWDPFKMRCQDCAASAWQAAKHTTAAVTCDHCSTRTSIEQLAEGVIQMPPVPGHAPVILGFRLCADCQAANQQDSAR